MLYIVKINHWRLYYGMFNVCTRLSLVIIEIRIIKQSCFIISKPQKNTSFETVLILVPFEDERHFLMQVQTYDILEHFHRSVLSCLNIYYKYC